MACAELNRKLEALASVAPEIHIVFDGVPPISKQTELDSRHLERVVRDELAARNLAEGRPLDVPDDLIKSASDGLGGVYEAFEERYLDRRSRLDDSRPFVTLHRPVHEGDPECARVAIACNGLVVANDTDYVILNTPHGVLFLNHEDIHFSQGRLSGLRASQDLLVAGVNKLLAGMPRGVSQPRRFAREDLPLFAALGACDQTKHFEDQLKEMTNAVWPCKHGLNCSHKDTCWRSHDPRLLQLYGCPKGNCEGGCGLSHTRGDRSLLQCHFVEMGGHCGHYNCFFSPRPQETARTAYHIVQGAQQSARSPEAEDNRRRSQAIAKFALCALLCLRPQQQVSLELKTAVEAARVAYDLDHMDDGEIVLHRLWRSHPSVWNTETGAPSRGACSELMSWEDSQWLTPWHPERDPDLPSDINLVVRDLNHLAVRGRLFWNAHLAPSEWSPLARPDIHLHGIHAYRWTRARAEDDDDLLEIPDPDTAHRCDWMPSLTPEQEAQRPLLGHVAQSDRIAGILGAAGMSSPQAKTFATRLAKWTVESHDVLFGPLGTEPPEELVVALWIMRQNWGLSPAELAVFAELIVCGDRDNVVNSQFGPDRKVHTSPWHDGCEHVGVDRQPCSTPVTDYGTAAWKRRQDLVAQWRAAVDAVGSANSALDHPLLEGDNATEDSAMLHVMLARGGARVRCGNPVHRQVMDQLVALMSPRQDSPIPAPADGGDGSAAPKARAVAPAAATSSFAMFGSIPSARAERRRTKLSQISQSLAGKVEARAALVTRIREQEAAETPVIEPVWTVEVPMP